MSARTARALEIVSDDGVRLKVTEASLRRMPSAPMPAETESSNDA